jgi:beta-glucosidase
MKMRSGFFILFTLFFFAQVNSQTTSNFRWLDTSLPAMERAELLVSEMNLDEKISQLVNASPAIPRLNVPEYNWWNECLHGVARNGKATVFPQAIAFGASFDNDLIFQVATAISDEARAKFNIAQKMGNFAQYAGLTFWTPNINIFRDPRWGRGQETYGEDPYLTSRIGVAMVEGLQGNDPNYLKVAACAKHYAVHSGPEALRHVFNAEVNQKDLWETYLPAFKALVTEAKVEAVMGAYNRTNGLACCASPFLLQDVLRNQWGFKGHVMSDCGAIADIWETHKLAVTPEEASAMSIKAGLDMNCGNTFSSLKKAVDKKLLNESDIDKAITELMATRFRLGLFDPKGANPYNSISPEVIGSEFHTKLARQLAQESIVMVKNKNQVLPLKKDLKTLYVTGPQAANEEVLLGNYYGMTDKTVNILEGIVGHVSLGTTINYKYGVLPFQKNINPIDWTTEEAKTADACIAVMGISGLIEGEEGEALASTNKGDRTDGIGLPENQIEFLKKLKKGSNKPLIVIITGGSPIAIPEVYDLADAVLYVWYPGEQGGNAVADLLFGDVSPSGRLPFTVPYSLKDIPPYEDYSMKGRTYRYMEKEPEFPFGFGLSFTSFQYSNAKINWVEKDKAKLSVTITNSGKYAGDEVVQVYLSSPLAGQGDPIYSLIKFKRVSLKPGESKSLEISLDLNDFLQVDEDGKKVMRKGIYKITIGGAVPGKRSIELGASITGSLLVEMKYP